MSEQTFTELESLRKSKGPEATIEHLIVALREDKKHHNLFDALLMRKKLELGAPLVRPTSFDDVPEGKRDEFEKAYIAAAREVGESLLKDNAIGQAWMYLRTIREPQKVAEAIAAIPKSEANEEIIDVAFFQGVNPAKGIEMLLASHGTCSTITSLDQNFSNLTPEARKQCSALLVKELYDSLRETLQNEVQRRQPMLPPGASIRELIAGRDWLFADDSYHVDVSHLNAVVRFARSLDASCPELKLALQLALYGSHLSQQYQYAGNAPFEEFYPSHIQYFKALADDGRDEALGYFREKLKEDVADPDTQLAAFAFVDLLERIGRHGEAVDVACKYLAPVAQDYGLSIPELCAKAGRYDTLRTLAREQNDLINFTVALVEG